MPGVCRVRRAGNYRRLAERKRCIQSPVRFVVVCVRVRAPGMGVVEASPAVVEGKRLMAFESRACGLAKS